MQHVPARLLFALATLLAAPCARADVHLPAVFGDHMVLQRDLRVPIWGRATPGEEVTVTIRRQHLVAKAGRDGGWRVELAPMRAGGPYRLTVAGRNRVTFDDVLVGEVWVCSGQSNMQFTVHASLDGRREVRAALYPKMRLFKVPRKATTELQSDTKAAWVRCTPETVSDFTAVGYFFGRELHRHLHEGLGRVPVGLIETAWGGTRVEAWTSMARLERTPAAKPVLEAWAERITQHPRRKKLFDRRLASWREAAAAAKRAGRKPPRRPRPPQPPRRSQHYPANLYNGMVAPIVPYGIRGAIWYQGESNAARAYQYRALFPAMIEDWRAAWGQGDFPFLFVQLANWTLRRNQDPRTWAELREAQAMTLSLPRTGMAVTIDIGDPKNIHPKNKQEVGRRLGLLARARVFGEDVVDSGPTYDSMHVAGGTVELRFRDAAGGLVAHGERVEGFEVAGADRKFVAAEARIEGETVVVRARSVTKPVAVRYAWSDNPACNLFNRAGLPASPFRTDDWAGVTAGKVKP